MAASPAQAAEAASETFTVPLAGEDAAAAPAGPQPVPVEEERSDGAPPLPLFSLPSEAQPGAGPAASEISETAPTIAAPKPATPEAEAPAGEAPDETASQGASRGSDSEALLRQLMADDSVVAIVDGKAILWGEVWRELEALPGEYRGEPERLFPALLRRAIDMILLANAARREDLQNDPAIRHQVNAYEERLLREAMLQRQIDAAVSEESLRVLYVQHIQRQAAAVEVTASHIQLDSEAAARAVIAELDQGGDFATLARQRSLASSGGQGGSLGTFRLDRMPPGFAAALTQLRPGDYSRVPAKSEFGWHVIKLERRDGAALPSFAELEPELRKEAERKAIDDLLQDLRQRASIEIMPVVGEQRPD